ncbi:hypothetical protein, partial [Paenibacillus lignilyticus]
GTPPAFVLSQDQTLHKSGKPEGLAIFKNSLGSSFKKLALRNVRFAIYDHLTGRSLFSFQRTNTSCFMRPCLSGDLINISHSVS